MSHDVEAARLRAALKSLSRQCGTVIFESEKTPASNADHLRSWEQLKKYIDDTLQHRGRDADQTDAKTD